MIHEVNHSMQLVRKMSVMVAPRTPETPEILGESLGLTLQRGLLKLTASGSLAYSLNQDL